MNTSLTLALRANAARWKQGWEWALVLTVPLVLALALNRLPFTAVDWLFYEEEVLAHPLEPYRFSGFFNPPWAVWLLLPLSWMPYSVGMVRLMILALFVWLAYSRGVRGVDLALLAASAPLLSLVANGNIDFLPALAWLVGPAWGLPLLLVKPQTGIFAALAWLRRTGGWRGAMRLLLPTLGVFALSLLLYGWWPARAIGNVLMMQGVGLPNVAWNTSIFPWGVPFGVYFAWRAWRDADEFHGVTASLLLSPYTPLYSLTLWYTLFLGRARRWQAAAVWLVFWLVYAWHFLGVGRWVLNRIS